MYLGTLKKIRYDTDAPSETMDQLHQLIHALHREEGGPDIYPTVAWLQSAMFTVLRHGMYGLRTVLYIM